MSLLRKKRSWSQVFRSPVAIAGLTILCIFLAMSVYERYSIERGAAERRLNAEHELQALRAQKAELEEKVEYLNADHGIEAEIRQHFDVARAGEQVIIIVDDTDADAMPAAAAAAESEEKGGFWSRLLP